MEKGLGKKALSIDLTPLLFFIHTLTLTRIFHLAIGHILNLFIFRTTSHKRTDSWHLLKHVRKAVRLERKRSAFLSITYSWWQCFGFVWRINTSLGELATSVRRKFGQLSSRKEGRMTSIIIVDRGVELRWEKKEEKGNLLWAIKIMCLWKLSLDNKRWTEPLSPKLFEYFGHQGFYDEIGKRSERADFADRRRQEPALRMIHVVLEPW